MTYKCSACGHTVTRQTPAIGTLYCNAKFCDIHGFPVKMEPIKEYKMTKEDELALHSFLDKYTRAITLLKCAQADLAGEIDFIDPNGEHPARNTLTEIDKFLHNQGD